MKVSKKKLPNIKKIITWLASVLIASITIVSGYLYLTRDASSIPANIKQQLTFSPMLVSTKSSSYFATDYKFSTAEGKVQILTYVIHFDSQKITVSEYIQPPEFTDIPEYKDRFLSNIIKQYATVQTASGTVYLGHMAKQNNKQLGIMIEKGLIIFFSPNKDLSQTQWRTIGERLEIKKVEAEKG